ncbi:MAG: trehalose 6-phosphate synthase [Desulfobacterales bacterium]|nr:trehalose 6-phosphate synthase [Desulfobacterales bacterium]
MNPTLIEKQEIRTVKQFYNLMAMTRDIRCKMVKDLFNDQPVDQDCLASLKNALLSLEDIPSEDGLKILHIDDTKKISARLLYEISELEKDIFFLQNNEKKFIDYLENLHQGFVEQVNQGIDKLKHLQFNCFITDRDGTINNYCGRYISSVQSVYNSVFLTRFAREKTSNPIIITSAPLKNPGLVDVSINPDKTLIYAASKGREYIGLDGKRKTYPIEENKQLLLDKLNKILSDLVKKPSFEMFSMIGSGLQFKFGQTTIARQDIRKSIPESESNEFLEKINHMVKEIDPGGENFKIEDTGLDIEIILTIEDSDEDSGSEAKDFNKADAVNFLNDALNLNMKKGPHLVCGDTSSDTPLIEATMEKSPDTWAVFVTENSELSAKVKAMCPNSLIVTQPDILVTILGFLALGKRI